jgi:iron complex transport system substrate-binding protein
MREVAEPKSTRHDDSGESRRWSLLALAVVIVAVFIVCGVWRSWLSDGEARPATPKNYRRIVSLAPSITEILFQLGLGDRVVGVSRYCKYPAEACDRPRVGGFFDPNIEVIRKLRPDLVIVTKSATGPEKRLGEFGLDTLSVEHRDPEGIFESIHEIGRICQVEKRAERLVAEMRARLKRVTEKVADRPAPRVMIAVDHTLGGGRIENVYVAGGSAYFNPIIRWAGGRNVFEDVPEAVPVIAREAMLQANPEVIVDLIKVASAPDGSAESYREAWGQMKHIDAVKDGRVYVLTEDYATVPGPRFVLVVEDLAKLLHPEVDWGE